MTTRTTRSMAILGAAALAAALAGCAGAPRGEDLAMMRTTPLDAHPIGVAQYVERLEIAAPIEAHTLSQADREALSLFARAYQEVGHGAMTVSLPDAGAQAAVALAAEARALLVEEGLSWAQIVGGAYAAPPGAAPRIVLSFLRHRAQPEPCRPMSDYNLIRTADNLAYGRWGCAQAHNLAKMVADPADLLGPRAVTPSDAGRRDTVLRKYREGSPTGATRSEDERGDVRSGVGP